jgi:hypothetical protein
MGLHLQAGDYLASIRAGLDNLKYKLAAVLE